MITVKLFARIREDLDCRELQWTTAGSVRDLVSALGRERGGHWSDVLLAPQVIVAINQQVGGLDSPLDDGDEVAFFPPVTGG